MNLTEELQISTISETRFLVLWNPRPGSDLTQPVNIYRSDDMLGTYTLAGTVPLGTRYYVDVNIDAQKYEYPYYKVECGGNTEGPICYEDTRVPESKILLNNVKAFLQRSGYPVLHYMHKNSGERCSCWDSVVCAASPSCKDCYGTGYVGGFDGPIVTLAQVMQISKFRRVDLVAGTDEPVNVNIRFWGIPTLRLNDVIRDLVGRGLYRVTRIEVIGPHQSVTEQMALGRRLKSDEVEQFLPKPNYFESIIPLVLPYHIELLNGLNAAADGFGS